MRREHARFVQPALSDTCKQTQSLQAFMHHVHEKASENCELKLQIVKWRKRTAVLRLKLSSIEETVHQLQSNEAALRAALNEALESQSLLTSQLSRSMGAAEDQTAATDRLKVRP